MIGKLAEVTLVEAIRKKRFPREKYQKSGGAELKITKPNSTISTNSSNRPVTEKSWDSPRGTGFPENGALWDGGESNPSTYAHPQQGKPSVGFEASACSSEISRPMSRSAPGSGLQVAGPQ